MTTGWVSANIVVANRKKALNPAWRAKLSEIIREKYIQDPTYRERLAAANFGKRHNHTTRIKMSKAHLGKKLSPETRAKIAAAARRPERLAAVSLLHYGVPKSYKTRRRMRVAARKRAQNPEWLRNTAVANRRKAQDPVWRESVSLAVRKKYEDPVYRAKCKRALRRTQQAARRARPSSIERAVHLLLDELEIFYVIEHRIGRYLADIFIPERKFVVECDGTYWHGRPGNVEYDARRDAYMRARGYTVLRLPEHDIREGLAKRRILRVVGDTGWL